MRLVSKLLARIGIATGTLLILLMAAITLYVWKLNLKQAETSLQVEVSNSAASIRKFYSSGDLVSLRGTLDQIADSSKWISASFYNLDGDRVWIFSKSDFKQETRDSISSSVDVYFENGERAGRLEVLKDLSSSQNEVQGHVLLFVVSGLIFWIFSVFVTLYVSKKSLSPLLSLMTDIKSEALSKGVNFEENHQFDEIRNIQIWFSRLSESWLTEKRRAMENERSAAIAQMTQMLAHDIRKPFSMFKAAIDTIMGARSASELKMITQDFIPEINRAMSSVNGLLQDVMEVSSKALPHFEQVRPESLIETTLVDLFSMQEGTSVALAYELEHRHNINADAQKMMRVFLNICGNAVQAMNGKGYLKFSTRETESGGKRFVEFSILNTGSFIPEGDIGHLFEAFFTKNKKGGTGLGLAIAQKVVVAHGGTIFCRSRKDEVYPQGFVEFVFTIPAGEKSEVASLEALPNHSSEMRSRLRTLRSNDEHDAEQALGLQELEVKVLNQLKTFNRKLNLLAVDDEQVYKNAIRLHCERNEAISQILSMTFVSGSNEISLVELDGAILDVDLGKGSLDGFEIARDLRKRFASAFICVHSNRTFADDFRRSLDSGADAFLPKPMSYEHFLRFLAQLCSRLSSGQVSPVESVQQENSPPARVIEPKEQASNAGKAARDLVVVVDDSKIVLTSWKLKLKDAPLETFESPEAFFAKLNSSNEFADRLAVVVTDFHFGTRSMLSGYEFALKLRKQMPVPVVLSSDGEFDAETLAPFALSIPKHASTFSELLSTLRRAGKAMD